MMTRILYILNGSCSTNDCFARHGALLVGCVYLEISWVRFLAMDGGDCYRSLKTKATYNYHWAEEETQD